MSKIQDLFTLTVSRVENNPTPLRRYIFLFFAILTVRLCLEFFSNHRLFTFQDILHIGLWFIFIVLAFLVQLYLFSGEQITKVVKLVITCFTIALTAPILDMIIGLGYHYNMNYLSVNSINDLGWAYLTIGGSSMTRGATPGIRIEIVLLMIGCFQYVYLKRKSFLRAIVATLSIYTVLFFSGTIPFLLNRINSVFNLHYSSEDQSTILLLFTLDLALVLFILFRSSPESCHKIIRDRAFLLLFITVPYFVLGALLANQNYPGNWSLNPTTLYWFPLIAMLFLFFHGYHTSIYKQRENNNYYLQNSSLILVMSTSSIVSAKCFFSAMVIWALLFLLFEAPAYLSRIPVLSAVLQSMILAAFMLLGFTTFGGPMVGFDPRLLVFIFCMNCLLIFLNEKGFIQFSSRYYYVVLFLYLIFISMPLFLIFWYL